MPALNRSIAIASLAINILSIYYKPRGDLIGQTFFFFFFFVATKGLRFACSNDIFRMIVFSFGFGRFLKIRKRVSSVDDIGRWMIWMEEKRENVYLEVGCNKDRYPGFV